MKKIVMAVCAVQMLAVYSADTDGQNASADIFTQGEFFVGCNYWSKNAGMYMWREGFDWGQAPRAWFETAMISMHLAR